MSSCLLNPYTVVWTWAQSSFSEQIGTTLVQVGAQEICAVISFSVGGARRSSALWWKALKYLCVTAGSHTEGKAKDYKWPWELKMKMEVKRCEAYCLFRGPRSRCQCWWSVESHVRSPLVRTRWSSFGTWPTFLASAAVLTTTRPWAFGAFGNNRYWLITTQGKCTFVFFALLTQNRWSSSVRWRGWMRWPSCWGRSHTLFLASLQKHVLVGKNVISAPLRFDSGFLDALSCSKQHAVNLPCL